MKAAYVIPSPEGGSIEIRDVPVPEPGPGQVLVKVHASALNRAELAARRGLYVRLGQDPFAPGIMGGEFAGEVAAVGSDVSRLKVGDRVFGMSTPGARAEFALANPVTCIPIPDNLTYEEAASIPTVFITAHDAIVTNAQLQPGESLLVNAASSGVGIAAIQIAKALGANPVIGSSRTPGKLERLKALGMDEGIVQESGFEERLQELTGGKGVDVVIDNVGGPVLAPTLKGVAIKGRLVSVGRLGGNTGELDLDYLAFKRISIIGVTFRTRTPREAIECSDRFAVDLMPYFADGRLKPVIDSVYPLEELDAAQQALARNQHTGKIVIRIT